MKKNKRRKSRSREFKKNSDIIDIEEARAQRKAKREKQEKQAAKKRLEENRGNLSARRRAKQKRFRAVMPKDKGISTPTKTEEQTDPKNTINSMYFKSEKNV